MARGTTLANLLLMLKAETGQVMTAGVGEAEDTRLKYLLAQQQQWLAAEFDWPFLERTGDVLFAAGDRTGTLPTTLDYERPVRVVALDSDVWRPLVYGISPEEFIVWNSDEAETADPILKWKYATDTTFEVWPIPATATTVRFTGQKELSRLTETTDTADLDDLLIVLFTAAELLAGQKQSDAQAKLVRAQARLNTLKSAYPKANSTFVMGGGSTWKSDRDFMGGTITGGGLANTAGGTTDIANGAASGTVVYGLTQAPISVLLTVQAPAGGLVLTASLDGAATSSGFSYNLSGATDSADYKLHWEATLT